MYVPYLCDKRSRESLRHIGTGINTNVRAWAVNWMAVEYSRRPLGPPEPVTPARVETSQPGAGCSFPPRQAERNLRKPSVRTILVVPVNKPVIYPGVISVALSVLEGMDGEAIEQQP